MSKIKFLKTFIKDIDVASVIPTSLHCVKKICKKIDFTRDIVLVEYGPGDGVFSRYLLENMTPGSRLIMIESNQGFARHLIITLNDSRAEVFNILAGDIIDHIEPQLIGNVDYVLSGIPFSFLKPDRKRKVLTSTKRLLREGGKFLAYQTSNHLKKPVLEVFGNVETEMEMLNIPPYVIYDVVKNGI